MRCTRDMVDFKDAATGEIYCKITDCPLVIHWKRKYAAKRMVEWWPGQPQIGLAHLEDADAVIAILPGSPKWQKGDTVWAVSSEILGASDDAALIRSLAFASTMEEYQGVYQSLLDEGYPKDVLNAIAPPT